MGIRPHTFWSCIQPPDPLVLIISRKNELWAHLYCYTSQSICWLNTEDDPCSYIGSLHGHYIYHFYRLHMMHMKLAGYNQLKCSVLNLCKLTRSTAYMINVCTIAVSRRGRVESLCCLMTPALSKDIQYHVWPYVSELANHQIRHQVTHKWAVSLVIAYGHFYGLTYALYHPWGSLGGEKHRLDSSVLFLFTYMAQEKVRFNWLHYNSSATTPRYCG